MSRKKQRLTGQAALEQAYSAVDHSALRQHLGVELPDDLLRLALTHRSFANENGNLPNNERLEFLGDAVLGLSVAAALYDTYPDKAESDISKMRASIVSRYGLADIAREIGLGPHILLGRGEILTGGLEKDSILADTTEAILGAIYRRHGFHTAREVILRLFGEKLAKASSTSRNTDWKTSLQERAAERKYPMPVYEASSTGPDHDRTFTASVSILGIKLGIGVGANKKTAEQQAAQQAHAVLSDGSANQALVEAHQAFIEAGH
ncbi:ribonuclease III [Corynebacterium mendelii]|uniref:Ribonuclease 3 n=1 Tax=Corynebacterium mendelii TaxID=2765362 RepID=A0A939IX00_9CORY|nr:ribonuclease III [Corynebacterium mendelii]